MIKRLVKISAAFIAMIAVAVTIVSCNFGKNQTRYVAAMLTNSDMWSIVDLKTGEIIHKDEFKNQPSVIVNDKFFVKNDKGLYDYFSVNDVKKPINKEAYLYATAFNENDIALAVSKGDRISIINGKCKEIAKLDDSILKAGNFSNGFAAIANDEDKMGFINEKGEIVIKPIYNAVSDFSKDGYAMTSKEINDSVSKISVIDKKGKVLFSFNSNEYKKFGAFNEGYLPVMKKDGKVVLLDKKGKPHSTLGELDGDIYPVVNGLIIFEESDTYGIKDIEGTVVVRAKYNELYSLDAVVKNQFLAKKQDKYGIIDKDDNIIVPFDYEALYYINENVLVGGEDDNFTFMTLDLKDLGTNNYKEISFETGGSVHSNYFNADKEAQKIISKITDDSFFNVRKGMVLRDFKDKLSGSVYSDMNKSTLTDIDYPYDFTYCFDRNLATQQYEYYYGYSFPSTPEYNYSANLVAVVAKNSSYKEFQPGYEEKLAKAFDTKIKNKGFNPIDGCPNWFKNKNNISVALGYENGDIYIYCAFNPELPQGVKVTRKSSKKDSDDSSSIEAYDCESVACETACADTSYYPETCVPEYY